MARRNFLVLSFLGGALLVSPFTLPRLLDGPGSIELDQASYDRTRAQFAALLTGASRTLPGSFEAQPALGSATSAMLREREGDCRGGGIYMIRPDDVAGPPLLLSAPHRRADMLTGQLTLRLFEELGAAAAAWNSIHRRAGETNCAGTTDLARLERHPFTAFSLAFAQAYPDGRVVQIHGFDPNRRVSTAGRNADVILSSGSETVTRHVQDIVGCLRDGLPDRQVAVYPDDVRELGASKNAQGRELRAAGFHGFVHVELASRFRQQLMEDKKLRSRFGNCIEAGL